VKDENGDLLVETKNLYVSIKISVPEGKRPLGRPRHRWDEY
jgi:hypothetical protein